MKIRRGKLIVRALMACAAFVLLPITWWGYRFYFPPSGPPPEVNVAALLKNNDPHKMLSEANRYYWTHNLPAASPLYERAEKLFEQSQDDRDAVYARIGLIRSQLQMPFGEMSDCQRIQPRRSRRISFQRSPANSHTIASARTRGSG
ncbi:MAG TPA: hypothetical protein VMD29_16200 [Terracidiphilus sp.]|nr:hypothetical protein [Terracidiphilus sp.]